MIESSGSYTRWAALTDGGVAAEPWGSIILVLLAMVFLTGIFELFITLFANIYNNNPSCTYIKNVSFKGVNIQESRPQASVSIVSPQPLGSRAVIYSEEEREWASGPKMFEPTSMRDPKGPILSLSQTDHRLPNWLPVSANHNDRWCNLWLWKTFFLWEAIKCVPEWVWMLPSGWAFGTVHMPLGTLASHMGESQFESQLHFQF